MKRILIACIALASAALLAACSPSAPASSSSASSSSSESSSSSVSSSTAAGDADVVSVGLDYSAGTGYEWQCTVDPEGVVEQVGQETEDLASDKNVTGGALREVFTLRAKAPGEVVVTFDLVRSWEDEPAETQVYAFTVDDDLNMILNPYKSDFENEPEWSE